MTQNFTDKTTFSSIRQEIGSMREQKGKEKETLSIIDKAIGFGHGFMVNLLWERTLSYQHMVMNGDKNAIAKMEAATLSASKYVKENNLKEWESRNYRFLGRLYDYKKEFGRAIVAYKRSLATIYLDPEPFRGLELTAFLSFSTIMSGKVKEGVDTAKKLFKDFDLGREGKALKSKDYFTWAVWRSGIAVRTVNALIDLKQTFDKKEMTAWLKVAEADLKKGDFSYRKAEIEALKKRLQEN